MQRRHRVRGDREHRRHLLDCDAHPLAHRAAHVVDMLIVQDGEEPGAQIGAGLPQMLFGDGAGQAALNQIVGPRHIARQRAGIAPQPRDLNLEQPSEIAHCNPSSLSSRPCDRGSTMQGKIGTGL